MLLVSSESIHNKNHVFNFYCAFLLLGVQDPESLIDDDFYYYLADNVHFPSELWSWFYSKAVNMLSCSTNCRSLRGGIYNKTVYIMNRKEVSLLFNGVSIVPKDLNTSFKSPDELSSILTTFDALNYCEGIYDPTLKTLDVSNKMGGSRDIFGVWRSKCCSFGYLLHARPCVSVCKACEKTVRCDELDLPSDFTADHKTALRNRGGLIFVTVNMFKTFRVIEKIVESHFQPLGQI